MLENWTFSLREDRGRTTPRTGDIWHAEDLVQHILACVFGSAAGDGGRDFEAHQTFMDTAEGILGLLRATLPAEDTLHMAVEKVYG